MTRTVCTCDLCQLEIRLPGDGNAIGFGASNGLRTAAPIPQTSTAGLQVCGDCVRFLVGVWKARQAAEQPTPT